MGCQEEVVKPTSSVTVLSESASARSYWPKRLKRFKCQPKNMSICDCLPVDGNCLPTVVITPDVSKSTFTLISSLLDTIQGGNQEAITKYIVENKEALSKYIEYQALDGVIQNEYKLSVFRNIENPQPAYLLVKSSNDSIEVVYPFELTK